MNEMIKFAENKRTTTYFRDEAILKIRVAYRIMEYLAPDDIFKPELNQFTKDLILNHQFNKAFEYVMEEISLETTTELGSSVGYENMQHEAIELMEYLLPLYEKRCKDVKEQRRIELLAQLRELNNSLFTY